MMKVFVVYMVDIRNSTATSLNWITSLSDNLVWVSLGEISHHGTINNNRPLESDGGRELENVISPCPTTTSSISNKYSHLMSASIQWQHNKSRSKTTSKFLSKPVPGIVPPSVRHPSLFGTSGYKLIFHSMTKQFARLSLLYYYYYYYY